MIFQLTTKSGTVIYLKDEEAVKNLLAAANQGKRLVLTEYGVVDISSIDSIVPAQKKMDQIDTLRRMTTIDNEGNQKPQYTKDQAVREALGPAPLASLIQGHKQLNQPR